jgi:hypothetical protein
MARCGCAGTTCTCVVEGSGSVVVTGGGSEANPFVVNGPVLNIVDTATVNLTKTGAGTAASPWSLSADATVTLDALTDVSTAGATTGQVLSKKADGTWGPAAAPTAAPGLISTGNSVHGDGSAGSPLDVTLATNSGLEIISTGLRLRGVSQDGAFTSYTPVLSATGGVAPVIGNGSITGRYRKVGREVHFHVGITWGSTTQMGIGYFRVSLPVAAVDIGIYQLIHAHMAQVGTGNFVGQGYILAEDVDKVGRIYFHLSGTTARAYPLGNSTPGNLPAGSIVTLQGTYEAAA